MRLFLYEFKKIWSWKLVLAIFAIGVFFWYAFFLTPVTHVFGTSYPDTSDFEVAVDWHERFGATLEEEERVEAGKSLQELYDKADAEVASRAVFTDAGIHTWAEYMDVWNRESEQWIAQDEGRVYEHPLTEAEVAAAGYYWVFMEETDNLPMYIQSYEHAFDYYDTRYESLEREIGWANDDGSSENYIAHLTYLLENREMDGIMAHWIMENLARYVLSASIFVVLSVAILLAPVIVREARLKQLQWSSRRGRRIILTQFLAMFASGMALALAEILVLSAYYATIGTQVLSDVLIVGFNTFSLYAPLITYGAYIVWVAVAVALLAMLSVCAMFVVSRYSKSNISMVLIMLPVLGVLGFLVVLVMESFLHGEFFGFLWGEVAYSALFALLALVVCAFIIKRERRCELL